MLSSEDQPKFISEHIQDLRNYLMGALALFLSIFTLCFYYSSAIYNVLTLPLFRELKYYHQAQHLIVTSAQEGFFTYIKLASVIALLGFIPFGAWLILGYLRKVIPASLRAEFVFLIGVAVPLLFYLGACFAYYVTFYNLWHFLVKFNSSKHLLLYLKISEFTSLALGVIFWFGIIFEMPVLLYILYRLGFLSVFTLVKARKVVILLAFIVAAIITPPDPLSQIIMALLLILLYEGSLGLIRLHSQRYITYDRP